MKFIFVLISFFAAINAKAQLSLDQIKVLPVNYESIVNFIKLQKEKGIEYFDQFEPSVTAESDLSKFGSNCHRFSLKISPEIAWKIYTESNPYDVWKGKVVNLGLIFDKKKQELVTLGDEYNRVEEGQIFFIEMSVFFRKFKFPVSMIVANVDEVSKSITFCYVKSGESFGDQTIQLLDDGKGGTKILHSSHHLSDNKLRDKTLYPIYHKMAIAEVHRNIKSKLP